MSEVDAGATMSEVDAGATMSEVDAGAPVSLFMLVVVSYRECILLSLLSSWLSSSIGIAVYDIRYASYTLSFPLLVGFYLFDDNDHDTILRPYICSLK
jgi:hypothetical protein